MALTLPSGRTQFCDANGKPLAGGFCYHYIPGTSTPKDTYQDLAGTLNTNPVNLDAAGEATIMGVGSYRQVVLDSLGNQQWDQVTATATLSSLGGLPLAGGTMTGVLIVPSISDTGGQLVTTAPTADTITTLTSLNVQGTTQSSTVREMMGAFGLTSNKGAGATGGAQYKTALYAGVEAQTGTGDVWAMRGVTLMDASSGTYNAFGLEIDLTNNAAARGSALGAPGLVAPTAYGLVTTGAGSFLSTAAHLISGPGTAIWNRGIVIASNSVQQAGYQDLGNSVRSIDIQGSRTYGIDTSGGTFTGAPMLIGAGTYHKALNDAGTASIKLVGQSAGYVLIGDVTGTGQLGIIAQNTLLPDVDNSRTCGAFGNRWSAVWAANGTIQTSDPSLKDDITPLSALPAGTVAGLLAAIEPIHFRWKSGGTDTEGNDRPGRRTHWGWNAEQVRGAFAATGVDFGGFVLAEDGTRHLRPDQLVPVLWEAMRQIQARITALEARP